MGDPDHQNGHPAATKVRRTHRAEIGVESEPEKRKKKDAEFEFRNQAETEEKMRETCVFAHLPHCYGTVYCYRYSSTILFFYFFVAFVYSIVIYSSTYLSLFLYFIQKVILILE